MTSSVRAPSNSTIRQTRDTPISSNFIENGVNVQKTVLIPTIQFNTVTYLPVDVTLPLNPDFPTTAFQNANGQVKFKIPKRSFVKGLDFLYRFDLTNTTATSYLPPVYNWIWRMDFNMGSTNIPITTFYGEPMFMTQIMLCKTEDVRSLFEMGNIYYDELYWGYNEAYLVNQTASFWYKWRGSLFNELLALYWASSRDDLWITIWPDAASGGGIAFQPTWAGALTGVGTVSTQNSLTVQSQTLTPDDRRFFDDLQTKVVDTTGFLEAIPVQAGLNQIFAPQTQTLISLQNLQGLFSHFAITFRNTGNTTNTAGGYMKVLNIGDSTGATMDILNPSGRSIRTNQAPIYTTLMRTDEWCDHFKNDLGRLKPYFYMFPLVNNVRDAYYGVRDGGLLLTNEPYQLAITPGKAAVQQVWTITVGQSNTSGLYTLAIENRGQVWRTTTLNSASTVTQIATALASLKYSTLRQLTYVVVGTLGAAGAMTITVTSPETNGLGGGVLTIDRGSLNIGGTYDTTTTGPVLTTVGYAGFPAGNSTIDCVIWAFKFKVASYNDGLLGSDDVIVN